MKCNFVQCLVLQWKFLLLIVGTVVVVTIGIFKVIQLQFFFFYHARSLLWLQALPCGFSSYGARVPESAGSVAVAHGLSCLSACRIFPELGVNPGPLHWRADSWPLGHRGSPIHYLFKDPISTHCHTCRHSELGRQHMNTGGTWWLVLDPRLHCRCGGLIGEIPSRWLSNIYRQEKRLAFMEGHCSDRHNGWVGREQLGHRPGSRWHLTSVKWFLDAIHTGLKGCNHWVNLFCLPLPFKICSAGKFPHLLLHKNSQSYDFLITLR